MAPILALVCLLATPGFVQGESDETVNGSDTSLSAGIVVNVNTSCSEQQLRRPQARITWNVAPTEGVKAIDLERLRESAEFRVDWSMFRRGLARGVFDSLAVANELSVPKIASPGQPAPADGSLSQSVSIGGLDPGVVHYVRVLAHTVDGWVTSSELSFRTPICPVDTADDGAGGAQ